ncbi:MAG: glycoside hydrolase family 78 protein [Propionibacteriaceae bacterium]|jgi:alpha-L-rhamnosidase|nr:glycoside hydrolase family 78 protein [Propionibacteriaceae bacterium]
MLAVKALRAEHSYSAVMAVPSPRLSWQIESDIPGWTQAGYQLRIDRGDGWTVDEPVESAGQVLVAWPFPALASREIVQVGVRVFAADRGSSEWSDPLQLEAGLFQRSDWVAKLIQPVRLGDDQASCLRREFDAGQFSRARLYITAQGVYRCWINGLPVSDDRLQPGWTSYSHRLRYQCYDVTELLQVGANAIGVILADGWYAGRLGWWRGGLRQLYGERTGVVAQLELTDAQGRTETVSSDAQWSWGTGGITATSFYDGEKFDQRLQPVGWDSPGFAAAGWQRVEIAELPAAELTGPQFPAIRVVGSRPVELWLTSPSGQRLADFGQVVTGHLRLRLRGAAGAKVSVRFAEVLDQGELALRPQRTASNTDQVILGASGELEWEPSFTFRSFRFAAIDDPDGVVVPESVTAQLVRNDLPRTGWFECSDPELNRLHLNAVWGIADNMLDVPTDCMLRDERLGWIGDAAHYSAAAAYLYDTAGLRTSWLRDLADDQRPNGSPTMVVPAIELVPFPGDYPVAVFSDAACMDPMTVYNCYGDREVLARQLPSMTAWAQCVATEVLNGFPTPGFQFGDWLDPNAPADNPENGRTEYDVVMALGAIRSAKLALQAATILGDAEAAARMAELARRLVDYFNAQYVTPNGLVASDSMTAYALALQVGALSGQQEENAWHRLLLLLRRRGQLETGYPGTYALMEVLAGRGRADLAYRLLNNRGVPSWRFALALGATTFWERWDSLRADGSLNPGDMVSFNHPVFSFITDWMCRNLAGLAIAEPGYRRFRVVPQPGGGVIWAKTSHRTPYGLAAVSWRIADGEFSLDVTAPIGTSAEVVLPGSDEVCSVGPGRHHFTMPADLVPQDSDTGRWGAHQHV